MNTNSPLISIIIPTRNRKEMLLSAINSALAQSYQNIQVVVHDNNSTDGTAEYLLKKVSDQRLNYYKSTRDLSMTENWNKAFQYVSGTFFLRLDDDNVISPDLVETAINEIKKYDLDVINFSPLIIHLNNRCFSLFQENNETRILSKFSLSYLEYFALIDSNYSMYRTSLITKLFFGGMAYQTTLPDRYMDYVISDNMEILDIKFGMNCSIKGLTRFDYRSPFPKNFSLNYTDYNLLSSEEILQSKDCQNNFTMHRVTTLECFLNQAKDDSLKNFFNQRVINPCFYKAAQKIGYVYMAQYATSWKGLGILNYYIYQVIFEVIKNPSARMDGRGMLINIVALTKNAFLINTKSLKYILLGGNQRKDLKPTPRKGDEIVEKIISGEDISSYKGRNQYGSLKKTLVKIRNLSSKLD